MSNANPAAVPLEEPPGPAPTTVGALVAGLAKIVEKAAWTFVQVWATLAFAADTIGASQAQAAAIAAIPAVLSAVFGALPTSLVGIPLPLDILYRAVRTGGFAFLGVILAVPFFTLDAGLLEAAWVAAIPAAMAVVKSAAASQLGDRGTAATLPVALDRPALLLAA